ncbi:MAG: DNA-processing protein DprA [Pseudomonadota bacterium]
MPAFDSPCSVDPALLFHSLRLARSSRIGPVTWRKMVSRLGSAEAALENLPAHAESTGINDYRPADPGKVRSEIERALGLGAQPLVLGTEQYPEMLAGLSDAPPVIWALGEIGLLDQPMVALVGARNASALGQRMAARLAEGLGEAGFSVVSGLARGIDRAAHFASLEHGTIAVLAGGIDVIYPTQNADLADRIRNASGLFLSEEPPGLQPLARHFPKRNRIISGLSKAVVLIEAAARSGSLITARTALDQGREVMAVPGSPLDPRSEGCNRIIRDGGVLVRCAADIVEALEMPRDEPVPAIVETESAAPPEALPGALAQQILGLLSGAPAPVDLLIRTLGRPAAEVLSTLTDLELNGQVERHPGAMVSAVLG